MMRRPALLFGLAALLFCAHTAARVLGLAEHTSVLAGTPITPDSWVLGPLHVVLHLAFVIVAPILVIAGTIETMLLLRRA
jgi:hypothetical protein